MKDFVGKSFHGFHKIVQDHENFIHEILHIHSPVQGGYTRFYHCNCWIGASHENFTPRIFSTIYSTFFTADHKHTCPEPYTLVTLG